MSTARTGLCFCGSVDDVAVALAFADLRDLRLRKQGHIASHLAEDTGGHRQRGCQLGHPRAIGVPWHHRLGKPDPCGEPARDIDAVLLQRRERPRGATQLHRETFRSHMRQQRARLVDGNEP